MPPQLSLLQKCLEKLSARAKDEAQLVCQITINPACSILVVIPCLDVFPGLRESSPVHLQHPMIPSAAEEPSEAPKRSKKEVRKYKKRIIKQARKARPVLATVTLRRNRAHMAFLQTLTGSFANGSLG